MPGSSLIKSLEQHRAEFAYKCVEQVLNEGYKGKYKSYAKKIPMLIKNNGLVATLAFVFSKVKKEIACELLYQQIEEWFKNCGFVNRTSDSRNNNDKLVKEVISFDSFKYRTATMEIIALFNWVKRFVDGLIEGEDEGEGTSE